jgi:N6-adenosine-specific RNA methylase IME4
VTRYREAFTWTDTCRYRTIVADPPWDYDNKGQYVRGGTPPSSTELPYSGLPLTTIHALDVAALCEPAGARLFLWATNRYLPDAFEIMAAWGFRYTQTLIWDKRVGGTPFAASVAPNHAEYLLVGVRGRLPLQGHWSTNILHGPIADHSRKPEVFLDMVEHVSPGPYLELFARRQRLGWDTWGNEALEHVTLT